MRNKNTKLAHEKLDALMEKVSETCTDPAVVALLSHLTELYKGHYHEWDEPSPDAYNPFRVYKETDGPTVEWYNE